MKDLRAYFEVVHNSFPRRAKDKNGLEIKRTVMRNVSSIHCVLS